MNNTKQRVALIAGVTGLVGRNCLQALLQSPRYSKVIALSRRSLDIHNEKLDSRVINFDELATEVTEIQCDDVFCCLGTTIKQAGSQENFRQVDYGYCLKLAELGKKSNAEHYLLVSAIGSGAKSPFFYNRVKGDLELAIEALNYDRFTIFQPSFLAGMRDNSRFLEDVSVNATLKLSKLLVGPFADYSVIQGKDLAAAMVARAQNHDLGADSGPRRLRYRKIMDCIKRPV